MSEQLITSIADGVQRRGLTVPAIFFLELYKPLTTVLHNVLIVGSPLATAFCGARRTKEFVQLFESREKIEELICLLESKSRGVAHGG